MRCQQSCRKADESKQIPVGAQGSGCGCGCGRGWNISNSFISMQCYGAAIHQKFAPKVRAAAAAKHLKVCYDSDYIPKKDMYDKGGRGEEGLMPRSPV